MLRLAHLTRNTLTDHVDSTRRQSIRRTNRRTKSAHGFNKAEAESDGCRTTVKCWSYAHSYLDKNELLAGAQICNAVRIEMKCGPSFVPIFEDGGQALLFLNTNPFRI
jgi:hypothetical protein